MKERKKRGRKEGRKEGREEGKRERKNGRKKERKEGRKNLSRGTATADVFCLSDIKGSVANFPFIVPILSTPLVSGHSIFAFYRCPVMRGNRIQD